MTADRSLVDAAAQFAGCEDLAARTLSPLAQGLVGSSILRIATETNALIKSGAAVANFTIGDFDSAQFPIPPALRDAVGAAYDAGKTNYPPAVGTPELRASITKLYREGLGLSYPVDAVQVGSGARPPIYALFATLLAPGELVVFPVPSWNNNHYAYLCGAKVVAIPTKPEEGFMPSAADFAPYLSEARLICLNSPNNPTGTMIREDQLRAICEAVLAENARRAVAGQRALYVFYDQVYWQLTFEGAQHHTPVSLFPEMARYTILVDAISKCWAATGLRVGWAVAPPWIAAKMQPLIGHLGAWAALPEQVATASVMANPALTAGYMADFKAGVEARLAALHAGLQAMKADGLPVESIAPQGALYLTAKVDLIGKSLKDGRVLDEEGVRKALLGECGIAVVPFSAFGYPAGSGWLRFSVGAVSLADVDAALGRLRAFLANVA